jgi:hypothetical protein
MTEAQRYARLRELLPFAQGSTVDELIESQTRFIVDTQKVYLAQQGITPGQSTQSQQSLPERSWHTQRLPQEGGGKEK